MEPTFGDVNGDRTDDLLLTFATVASDFDINGDGIDDVLIGDPFGGAHADHFGEAVGLDFYSPHGAAYIVFGRRYVRNW